MMGGNEAILNSGFTKSFYSLSKHHPELLSLLPSSEQAPKEFAKNADEVADVLAKLLKQEKDPLEIFTLEKAMDGLRLFKGGDIGNLATYHGLGEKGDYYLQYTQLGLPNISQLFSFIWNLIKAPKPLERFIREFLVEK